MSHIPLWATPVLASALFEVVGRRRASLKYRKRCDWTRALRAVEEDPDRYI